MIIFLIVFLLLLLAVLLVDEIPQFYSWQSRIKIGRYTDHEIWQQKVTNKAILWLNNTPLIPIKDYTRGLIFQMLRKKYASKNIQSWQKASLLLGAIHSFEKQNSEQIKKEIVNCIDNLIDNFGNWKNPPQEIDVALLAFAIGKASKIYPINTKPAMDNMYKLIISKLGKDGTVMYRNATVDYRYVDTIGFIAPFLTWYGLKYDVKYAIDLAVLQIKNFEKYGMLQNKIPVHAYQIHTLNPIGIYGWGRGMGWFVIGTLETCDILPDTHSDKNDLKIILEKIAETLVQYQKKDGSFSWSFMTPDERSDTSATAVFAWFFKKMNKFQNAENALSYIKSVTRRDGTIDFSQGDTKAIGVYSQSFNRLPFTQGFVVRIF